MGEVHLPQALQDVADLRPPGHKNHDATLNTFTMDHFNHLKHQLEVDRISLATSGRFVAVPPAVGFFLHFSTPLIHSRFIHNLRILHINSMKPSAFFRSHAFSLCTRTTSWTCAWLSCGKASTTERGFKGTPGSGPWEKGELRPEPLERQALRSGKACRKSSRNISWMG